jgi:Tol biopolymer transport system component
LNYSLLNIDVKGKIEMKHLRSTIALITVPVALTILGSAHAAAKGSASGRTILVSRNAQGEQSDGVSANPTISGDGRFVAFQSTATNISPRATDGTQQIYVLDRKTGSVELISRNRALAAGNEASAGPAISLDGRFVTFFSNAENLVRDDTNEQRDVFVFDRLTRRIERVSVSSRGEQGTGEDDSEEDEHGGREANEGHPPSISAEGRFVVFWTGLNGLVGADHDDVVDVFVRDRWLQRTRRISTGLGGAPADGPSRRAGISGVGNLIVFDSRATNLVPGDTNGKSDIFAFDLVRGRLKKLSHAFDGGQANDDSLEPHADFSGRIVTFASWASNVVATDVNGTCDAFVVDRATSEVEMVSLASDGSQLPTPTFEAGPSPDGRYVTLMTVKDLFPLVTANLYVFDRRTKQLELLNVNSQGQPGDPLVIGSLAEPLIDPSVPVMSIGARSVVFWSTAANLVAGDSNGVGDVFIRERGKGKRNSGGHDRDNDDWDD